MKLLPLAFALAAQALASPTFSAWPHAPALTLTPFALSGCRGAPLLPHGPPLLPHATPPLHGTAIAANRCVGFGLAQSFRAAAATQPLGQRCVLTLYRGAGCDLAPRGLEVGGKHGKCWETGLMPGWLGGGNEASWSVMWNCNLEGH